MALKAKDIAKMLGVSTATVSIVVNNKPGVSDKKRKEILEKIHQMGCDYLIREVRKENKGMIGFVVYKNNGRIIDESPFFTYILEGITTAVQGYGYKLNFIYLNRGTPVQEQERQINESGCDGMIIFGTEMCREDLQVFIDLQIPFCVLDNSFQENDVDCVSINNVQGMNKALHLLYDKGHRKIGYIRSKIRVNSFDERFQVYRSCMEQMGLPLEEKFIVDVGYSEQEARDDIKAYLQEAREFPTAFFAENDFLACNVMQGMQEMGYRIPDDFSVIGFDDRPVAQMFLPKLTTVNVPKDLFGPSAVTLLMDRIIKKRFHSLKMSIGTELVERDSVKSLED